MPQETCELFERLKSSRLFLVLGINVIEDEASCLATARQIQQIAAKLTYPVIFKASFDKANRTECTGYRGIGLEKGIKILHKVKSLTGLPILTDIHESWQATKVAEVADVIQIPAFLCRQTDLIMAAARTDRIINVKKGQWCSADVTLAAARKVKSCGNKKIILCERGTSFGYNELIVDMTNFEKLKQEGNLTLFDATHSCQKPGINCQEQGLCSRGSTTYLKLLCKAALASGANGLFIEVHEDPEVAPVDGLCQWPLQHLEQLLHDLLSLASIGH